MRKHNTTAALIMAAATLLTACQMPNTTTQTTAYRAEPAGELATMSPATTETPAVTLPPTNNQEIDDNETEYQSAGFLIAEEYVTIQFDWSLIPDYAGEPYIEIDWPETDLSHYLATPKGQIILSPYDQLGRCGSAFVHATSENLPRGERGSTGMAKPSGWMQNKYDGVIDSEPAYLYNRAHLLMWAITGLTDTGENLITGTRYFNTEAMLTTELEVVRYIESGGELLYRVTPFFMDDNLLADGVLMEAMSIDGTFSICRYAYNVQPGIVIDYRTGDNWLAEKADTQTPEEEKYETTYVLNTNTHKFHLPGCDSVTDIKAKNRQDYTGSREDLIDAGYSPCQRCHP